jgi:mannosyl-3-phosphoglycerate phosphatase
MNTRFVQPACRLVVYTDLDGTLLDHDSYSAEPARPALERLAALGVPVIPVTSKTLAELRVLGAQLGLNGPFVAENGGLLALPPAYFDTSLPLEPDSGLAVEYLSPPYPRIVAVLDQLRQTFRFDFQGFADLQAADVSALTGLGIATAQHARRRLCSEPLIWRDSNAAFVRFRQQLQAQHLSLVQGGRFWHVLGQTDKARAIRRLEDHFIRAGFTGFTTIALGDSPNDVPMLRAADLAVIIRRQDGSWLPLETSRKKVETRASGPDGWNEFFQQYLDTTLGESATHRTTHG